MARSTAFLTSDGRFDRRAIMVAAHADCWTLRTRAEGIGTASITFRTERVYDRRRLATALAAQWRQARRQRLDRIIASTEAEARFQAAEDARRIRWAAEQAAIRAEIEAHRFPARLAAE